MISIQDRDQQSSFRRGAKTRTRGAYDERGKPASARPATGAYSLHIRVRAFAAFGNEAVDPRRHNGQRYRAELEHSIVESADIEFRSERLLRLFAGTHDRELGTGPLRST